jgi:hypothetical protein
MNSPGRPSTFTPEIAAEICERLAAGESLRSICRDEHMPARSTVAQWHINDVQGFSAQYTHAREMGLDEIADELLDISDDGSNDWMERNDPDNPGYVLNGEHSSRSRLRLDTRKWYLSKLAPKRYGDKQAVELSGHLALGDMTEDEIRAELAALVGSGVVPTAPDQPQDDADDDYVCDLV